MLEKVENAPKEIKDDFKDLLKISEHSLKKLWLTKENDIWDHQHSQGNNRASKRVN